jgi:hypothetical protein
LAESLKQSNANWEDKYLKLKDKAKDLILRAKSSNKDSGKIGGQSKDLDNLEDNQEGKPVRFKLKSISRPDSRRGSSYQNDSKNNLDSLNSSVKESTHMKSSDHENMKEQIKELISEKKRLEKINDDLSKKLMNSMKEQEIERVVNREKESKKNEH